MYKKDMCKKDKIFIKNMYTSAWNQLLLNRFTLKCPIVWGAGFYSPPPLRGGQALPCFEKAPT